MAQRELQVTALRPAAQAQETYVRPEFENNQAAINRLTQSIKATNDTRSKQQAQIDAVKESLEGGVEDPNDRTGWSTNPVYVSARLEARGVQYGDQLLTQVQDNYNSDFKLSSRDDGTDLEGWINEQLAPATEALGDNAFLLSGASSVLSGVREKLRASHLSYLDERAKAETASNMGFQVDRIIQGKVPKILDDGTTAEMNIFDKITGLNDYGLELAATTHMTAGEANEAVFNYTLDKALSFEDAEEGLAYLDLAAQLIYAKAGDGAVNAKASHAIAIAEDKLESKMRQDARDKAAALKTQRENAARTMSNTLVIGMMDAHANGQVFKVTQEDYTRFSDEADMDATEVNKLVNSMKASFEVEEHTTQRDNWFKLSTSFNQLRGSPSGLKGAYADMYKMVGDGLLHHSRLKEAQTLLKELETAAPVVKHKILEDSMRSYIKGAVERTSEWDSNADEKEAEYQEQWYALLTPLINAHYFVDPKEEGAVPKGFPSSNQLQMWAQQVKAGMNEQYADDVRAQTATTEAVNEWNSEVLAVLSNSATTPERDGKVNIAWQNGVGTSGITTFDGEPSFDKVNAHYKARPFVQMMVEIFKMDPTYEFEWGNNEFGKVGVASAAQHFDRVYGAGAADMWWKEYHGPVYRLTSSDYSSKVLNIRAIENEYRASKQKPKQQPTQ